MVSVSLVLTLLVLLVLISALSLVSPPSHKSPDPKNIINFLDFIIETKCMVDITVDMLDRDFAKTIKCVVLQNHDGSS